MYNEPLLAPDYEGLNELAIPNAAYLSPWKGSVPVTLPFEEEEYDLFLTRKQLESTVTTGTVQNVKRTEYSERWQINW